MMSVIFKGFKYFLDETTHTRSDLPSSCGVIGGLQVFPDEEVINAQMKLTFGLLFVSHASRVLSMKLVVEFYCFTQVKSAVLFL